MAQVAKAPSDFDATDEEFSHVSMTLLPNTYSEPLSHGYKRSPQHLFWFISLCSCLGNFFALSWIAFQYWRQQPCSMPCRSFEDVYTESEHLKQRDKSVIFDYNGVDHLEDFKTYWGRHWFEGTKSKVDRLWEDLASVQLISISFEESKRLPKSTARVSGSPGRFAVIPEVLHNVHCLKYIRDRVFDPYWQLNATDDEQFIHVEHCLGLLRQSVICEGNIQPIIFDVYKGFRHTNPGATPRKCRDWTRIWDWANVRNISSGAIDPTE